jgi:hypothetical protein
MKTGADIGTTPGSASAGEYRSVVDVLQPAVTDPEFGRRIAADNRY